MKERLPLTGRWENRLYYHNRMDTPFTSVMQQQGFLILQNVFTAEEAARFACEIDAAIHRDEHHESAVARGEIIVAARNILEIYPPACDLWRSPRLMQELQAILGSEYGLMRGLYFDKPPGKSWALPWHQDRAIAVKRNKLPSQHFGKPTTKSGVPHVESPLWLSEQIVLARIHLDAMTDDNGPLQVMPGSHRESEGHADGVTLHAQPGDVLLMSPLLFHRSGESKPGCRLHRRILHLEFTGVPMLPDGYEWHTFIPGSLS